MTTLGAVFSADRPAETIVSYARAVEAAGLDELWLWEDCFESGGVSASAIALAATDRITVGTGILPAVLRSAAVTAMEGATLATVYPGRFVLGLGHGVPQWMDQVGALPEKPVRALEEVAVAVRALLAGDTVTTEGSHVRLRDVRLGHPPGVPPPVVLGVRRPLGLRASGRSADGTILSEPAAPAYVRWARERIDEGRAAAGRGDPHRVTVFVFGRVDPDRTLARGFVASALLNEGLAAHLAALGRDEELAQLRALGDADAIAAEMPDDLVDQLAAAGTPAQVIASLAEVAAAGADSLVFVPLGPDPQAQVVLFAREVAPALRR